MEQIFNKIIDQKKLKVKVSELKKAKKIIGFTNGCFDILHVGHVLYLEKAKQKCDFLVLGVNSDASVKRLGKAPDRPINLEKNRAIVLAALASVDLVCIFEEDTPEQLIQLCSPDILMKGADYEALETDKNSKKYIVGSDFVRKNGGKIETIPFEEGFSTTNLIKKIKHE